jgi:ABC-type uncharacterized transport system substrate-binding protein
VLINPNNPRAKLDEENIVSAAKKLGQKTVFVYATALAEFERALNSAKERGAKALDVASDPLFFDYRKELAQGIARAGIPAIHHLGEEVVAGGLMSYGASIKELYRQAGVYAGEILRGAKPSDLPVLQPTAARCDPSLRAGGDMRPRVPARLRAVGSGKSKFRPRITTPEHYR